MPDSYEVVEGRFLNEYTATSAANDLILSGAAVPANKVWTIRLCRASCSVAETQIYWFAIVTRASVVYPVTAPASTAIAPAVSQYYPMLREGLEIKLFPGEFLRVYRAAATAASTISLNYCYYESDLPLYVYEEPQVVKRIRKGVSDLRQRMSGGAAAGGGPGSRPSGGGGGGGSTPLPV